MRATGEDANCDLGRPAVVRNDNSGRDGGFAC